MGDVIVLRSTPVELDSDIGHAFIIDACRAGEGLVSDRELTEKYELTPKDWGNIRKDSALMRAIQAERARRVLNGTAARESAAQHFVKAPAILAGIMESELSNPRHVIEASKELRATAASNGSSDGPTNSELFVIRIDLSAGGGPVETYEKTIKPMQIDASAEDGSNNLIPWEGKPDVNE